MLDIENLHTWTIEYKIADVATRWVQRRYEKEIDERLVAIAKKGQPIRKDCLTIRVVSVSLWTPYQGNGRGSYIVVSVKISYKEESVEKTKEKNIGMCKLFFDIYGTLNHDEFEML